MPCSPVSSAASICHLGLRPVMSGDLVGPYADRPIAAGASRTHAASGAITARASWLTPLSVFDAKLRWSSSPRYTRPTWVEEIPHTWIGGSVLVESPRLAQIVHVGPVTSREDDRVDRLALTTGCMRQFEAL